MQIQHIYWIAAFLDGEGSFGFDSSPRISAVSTDKDLIEKYKRYSNLSEATQTYIPKDNRKMNYKVTVSGGKAIQWMMTIYPLMCARRKERIREVINLWKLAKVDNILKMHCNQGHPLSGSNLRVNLDGSRVCIICAKLAWQKASFKRSVSRAKARSGK